MRRIDTATFAQVYSIIISTLLCVILLFNLIIWRNRDVEKTRQSVTQIDYKLDCDSVPKQRPVTRLKYGADFRYLKLDHAMDFLWDGMMEPNVGLVFSVNPESGEEDFHGIAM